MLNTLDKKESLLLNTQDILHRIQDAHSDANVSPAGFNGWDEYQSLFLSLVLLFSYNKVDKCQPILYLGYTAQQCMASLW